MEAALSASFCGWYYHGFSGSVRHAVTAGAFTDRIHALVAGDPALVEVGTNNDPLAHMFSVISGGRFDRAQSLEMNGKRGLVSERVIPLLVPFTIQVVGPTANSLMETCLVAGVASKTSMYRIIENKVTARLNSLLMEHVEECRLSEGNRSGYTGVAAMRPCSFVKVVPPTRYHQLLCLEDYVHVYTELSGLPLATLKFAASMGAVMLMASIQHNADIDAGDRFRDKRGRQAALDEYESALKTALFH
tara:strand:- start:1206 stop:1946 length:741 start_codon:yes stop_codon:yes gene_type:complete